MKLGSGRAARTQAKDTHAGLQPGAVSMMAKAAATLMDGPGVRAAAAIIIVFHGCWAFQTDSLMVLKARDSSHQAMRDPFL